MNILFYLRVIWIFKKFKKEFKGKMPLNDQLFLIEDLLKKEVAEKMPLND